MMEVRRCMWNWLRKRISMIFEYVRIVGAVFSWYTLWKGNAMLSSIINREGRRQVLWEKDTGFMRKKKERLF